MFSFPYLDAKMLNLMVRKFACAFALQLKLTKMENGDGAHSVMLFSFGASKGL